ncbi:MAG: SRPBCC family protein [Dehalococcoidia bacterium]
MPTIAKSINVKVPVRPVYDQWTQFEEFPRFMEGVDEIKQMGDRHLHWKASIGGKSEEWNAEIAEQIPDKRIAWRNTTGAENCGVVTFHYISPEETRVTLQLDYDPAGIVETVGDKLGFMNRRVTGDLERFKQFIEARGVATGAWRGEIRKDNAG